MNNGKYLSLLDLARVDLMLRSGLAQKLNKRGWYPVVVAETIQFNKSLQLFDRFDVETRVLGWDDKAILVQHRFLRKGQEIASAVIKARFLKKTGGTVRPEEILLLGAFNGLSPQMPDWVNRWNADQNSFRENK